LAGTSPRSLRQPLCTKLLSIIFSGPNESGDRDFVYFQGHAAPGIYARAYLEGRIPKEKLENFRRELKPGGGLSSYPHPVADAEFLGVSHGFDGAGTDPGDLPRALHSLPGESRAEESTGGKVWAFLGDGEMDEPEALGSITLASRENLDNLIFVVNCNLQRLDGPVRGNGKIIQELEAIFRGAGWNVIKVHLGLGLGQPDSRRPRRAAGEALGEISDGQYQKYFVESGAYFRQNLVRHRPAPAENGGASFRRATGAHAAGRARSHQGACGVPRRGRPRRIADDYSGQDHQGLRPGRSGRRQEHHAPAKKLNEDELELFRSRFGIPIPDDELHNAPFYRPSDDSAEIKYMQARRQQLGGYMPQRKTRATPLKPVPESYFEEFYKGTEGREASTTMVFVRLLAKLLRDPEVGKLIVPIIPDEARTFGMEALFRQVGIYSSVGQLYEPVDMDTLLYYKEVKNGQILEEGITEAGSMCSFIAAGTAYANHGINTIPFFIYYSMFGFQRIGDLIWAAADMRCRGFLVGGTAGRTTLAGEGLQHQDGHSHVLALCPFPTCWLTIRHSLTRLPSSFRMASSACTWTRNRFSITSP
jgi:pyruvate dehydrogenase E1 component